MFSMSLHRYVKRVLLVTKPGLRLMKMGRIYLNNYLVLHEMLNSVQYFSVPTTPDNFAVCAVYDKVNETLQITETTWNELVCCV